MEFRVLGPLEAVGDDGPVALGGAKQRAVLAHLLLRANRVVSDEHLIDHLWDDDPPFAARNVLQTYVSRLRKLLGDERLERRSGGYLLHVRPGELDADRFRSLASDARRTATTDPAGAIAHYREADALWRGPALGDLADQPSLRPDIAHLEELRAATSEERIVVELSLGRHAELVPELESQVSEESLRESLWAHLITALYRSGRQADALAAYRRARATLVEELGIEPSAALRQLEQQVLRQDPALDVAGRPLRGFQMLEKIGEGAFGVVHRAFQPQVDREVAVKLVRPALANDPEFIRRFETEAQLVARLEHPHVVPLYDYWREPDGAYLVMRLMRGGSLRDVLASGPLPLAEALRVAAQVAGALASAHRHGVVHRDVKPGNILFDEEGNAYLSDFGIARALGTTAAPARADATPTAAGYVSPEELRGEEPTARADVFSLGRVFEAMIGDEPPAHVAAIVRRATDPDPRGRYADASDFLSALAGAAPSSAPVVAQRPPRNPYKGLRPFLEADAPDFRGRESLVARLVERLSGDGAEARLLALVGPSGSGKSSVVRAGLVPALRAGAAPGSDRWYVADLVPGDDPFSALAGALVAIAPAAPAPGLAARIEHDPAGLVEAAADVLADADAELLLVIDQLEELFTLVADGGRRAAFLTALRRAATDPRSRMRVVLTLRADFFDRPLAHAGFADVLRAGTELVLPLGPDELERAITGPAERAGAAVESALLAELISDASGQPGALPLLQFALAELYERRRDGTLTLQAYRELGGVGGALARGAEEIYGDLGEMQREAARELFLRLVDPREGARRRVPRSEVVSLGGGVDHVIDAFATRRLLSFDRDAETREPTVEIAHDALLAAWARLRHWLDAAAEDVRVQRQLAAAVLEWRDGGRDTSFLLRGARLERLEAWREHALVTLTPRETEFLDASAAERDRALAQDAARAARERELERRSVRRLRGLAGVLACAGMIAAALAVFAFDQRSEAEAERRVAVARELAAASVASLDTDAERSVLLALEAIDHTRSAGGGVLSEAAEALHRALVGSRITLRFPRIGGALDWSPDGRLFATEGPEQSGRIDIRDAATGRSVQSFKGHNADVNLVAFSPDGGRLATSGDDGALNVWETANGSLIQRLDGQGEQVWGVSFSPDGERVSASAWEQETVRVWDVETGRVVREVTPVAPSFTTSFSPDGERLAIATFDAGGLVVDLDSGELVHALEGQDGVSDVDWSPDGKWISTASFDSTIQVWDARDGRARFRLAGHQGEVVAVDWSADSRRLASGARDGTARVWEVAPGGVTEELVISAQDRGGGLWVSFSPDGERLMTGDQGLTAVKVWDVSRRAAGEWANVPVARGALGGVALSADGRRVVVASDGGTVTVADARTGARAFTLRAPRGESGAASIAMSRTGTLAAAAGDTVRTWNLDTRREGPRIRIGGGAERVAWAPDGGSLAVAGRDGVVRVLDRSGTPVAQLRDDAGYRVSALSFSPDGRLVAGARTSTSRTGTGSEQVTLWDWRRGKVVQTIPGLAFALGFSHDGARIAVAPGEGPVQISPVRGGGRVVSLSGHTGAVNDVAFAPHDARVATAGADGTVRLWDPDSGRQELVLRGHEGEVGDLAFSADGSKLASGGPEGLARVWALDLDDLIAIARRRLTRGFTPAECRQYPRVRDC